jgi:alanyl-tRNA synthetase
LKGAFQSVLGVKWTSSTYVDGEHGRLTVQIERKPTGDEMQAVEKAANDKVLESAEVIEFVMDRDEAERHFGDSIYDLFPVPADQTKLSIVRIQDWNVNCCTEKHLDSTSSVGRIVIDKSRFREVKKLLEVEFHVE